jgi:enoyl-CoA hydratase/carnithine racemase
VEAVAAPDPNRRHRQVEMADPGVRLEVTGPVSRLTFDRPHVLNAGDSRWVAELGAACRDLEQRRDVRVAVMTGAGRAFSTGVDLNALAAGDLQLSDLVAWEDAMTAIERMAIPFIAAINGHCLGGGLQLALVCDYRLASETALLGLPAVKECLIPSMALYRLPRLIGLGRATELMMLGDPISAADAERYGLVNRVVKPTEFAGEVEATIQRFLALPPASARAAKRLASRAFDLDFETFRAEMEAALRVCLASDEHRVAMEAIRSRTVDIRGPEMAPDTPGRSEAPRRSRGAPRSDER